MYSLELKLCALIFLINGLQNHQLWVGQDRIWEWRNICLNHLEVYKHDIWKITKRTLHGCTAIGLKTDGEGMLCTKRERRVNKMNLGRKIDTGIWVSVKDECTIWNCKETNASYWQRCYRYLSSILWFDWCKYFIGSWIIHCG